MTAIIDLPPQSQFEAGKRAFYAGVALSFDMPRAWRNGWQAAFGEACQEYEEWKRGKA